MSNINSELFTPAGIEALSSFHTSLEQITAQALIERAKEKVSLIDRILELMPPYLSSGIIINPIDINTVSAQKFSITDISGFDLPKRDPLDTNVVHYDLRKKPISSAELVDRLFTKAENETPTIDYPVLLDYIRRKNLILTLPKTLQHKTKTRTFVSSNPEYDSAVNAFKALDPFNDPVKTFLRKTEKNGTLPAAVRFLSSSLPTVDEFEQVTKETDNNAMHGTTHDREEIVQSYSYTYGVIERIYCYRHVAAMTEPIDLDRLKELYADPEPEILGRNKIIASVRVQDDKIVEVPLELFDSPLLEGENTSTTSGEPGTQNTGKGMKYIPELPECEPSRVERLRNIARLTGGRLVYVTLGKLEDSERYIGAVIPSVEPNGEEVESLIADNPRKHNFALYYYDGAFGLSRLGDPKAWREIMTMSRRDARLMGAIKRKHTLGDEAFDDKILDLITSTTLERQAMATQSADRELARRSKAAK